MFTKKITAADVLGKLKKLSLEEQLKFAALYKNETAEVLNTLWVYFDSSLPLHNEGKAIPQDKPYNKKNSTWETVTFMSGKAYRILCAQKDIKIKNFNSWDDASLHKHIASMFDINQTQAEVLCTNYSQNNWNIIKNKLNNQKSAGFQASGGGSWDEEGLYCWFPVAVDGGLVSAAVASGGVGRLCFGGESYAHFAFAV